MIKILYISLVFTRLVWAHGGGLDSEGCHLNSKTIEHHCHKNTYKELTISARSSSNTAATSYKSKSLSEQYDRDSFNFRSYSASGNVGFYTGELCIETDIDHIVSLKDAYDSGAWSWTTAQKKKFANDKTNHVESCSSVNRSKSSAAPKEFRNRSRDGKGLDYNIQNWCEYVIKYHSVKAHYHLSTAVNDMSLLYACRSKETLPFSASNSTE